MRGVTPRTIIIIIMRISLAHNYPVKNCPRRFTITFFAIQTYSNMYQQHAIKQPVQSKLHDPPAIISPLAVYVFLLFFCLVLLLFLSTLFCYWLIRLGDEYFRRLVCAAHTDNESAQFFYSEKLAEMFLVLRTGLEPLIMESIRSRGRRSTH